VRDFNYAEFQKDHTLAYIISKIAKAAGYPSSHGETSLTAVFEQTLTEFIDARIQKAIEAVTTDLNQKLSMKDQIIEAQEALIKALQK